jgi:hypothetical protein
MENTLLRYVIFDWSTTSSSSKMHCCSLVVITNLRFTCASQQVLETANLYLLDLSISILYLTTGNEDVRSNGNEDASRGSYRFRSADRSSGIGYVESSTGLMHISFQSTQDIILAGLVPIVRPQ